MLESPKDCSSERLWFITNGKAFIADCPSAAWMYVTRLWRAGVDSARAEFNLKVRRQEVDFVCVRECVCVFEEIHM